MRNVTIASVQMNCKLGDKNYNINKSLKNLETINNDTDIVCFPEFFTTGYSLDLINKGFYQLAETIPGETTEIFSREAKKRNIAIIGVIVEKDSNKTDILYDTAFVIDSNGKLSGKYRKTHIYTNEHRYFNAGEKVPVFELSGVKIGVAICFDHAFPQLFTMMAQQGAQIIFIPSVVPVKYEYLLELRSRARAQDNQVFVAAINRVGREGDVTYCGLSQIINPRGEVISKSSPDKEEQIIEKLNLDMILDERKREPNLKCLRPEIYKY